jgi:general secretion pathway protein G
MRNKFMERRASDEGFTLIELLIAIVVVGILTTVVIVGVGSLQNSGQSATCKASADAALAASNVHYANTTPSVWPQDLEDMVTPKEWVLPSSIAAPANGVLTVTINTKVLTMTPGATASDPPSFACAA